MFKGSSERLKMTPDNTSLNISNCINMSQVSGIEPFQNIENIMELSTEVSELFVTCTNCSANNSMKCQCENKKMMSDSNKR
jgi:thymidine kinase